MISLMTPILATYAPKIYTAPCLMLLKRTAFITRASARGWALETFLCPVNGAPPTCPNN